VPPYYRYFLLRRLYRAPLSHSRKSGNKEEEVSLNGSIWATLDYLGIGEWKVKLIGLGGPLGGGSLIFPIPRLLGAPKPINWGGAEF